MAENNNNEALLTGGTGKQQEWYSPENKEIVQMKGWKDPNEVVKSYTALELTLGNKVKIPDEKTSAEEISAFYEKLGRPKKPEEYSSAKPENLPEGMVYDEKFEKTIKGIAFEAGITKAQMERLVKAYNEYQIEGFNNYNDELNRTTIEGERILREEWSDKFDPNMQIARRACKELGGNEFVELLNQTKLGNNPVMIKTFLNIGKKMLDDTLIKGSQEGDKGQGYVPAYKGSPEMYAKDESEEGKKARAWFEAQGYKY